MGSGLALTYCIARPDPEVPDGSDGRVNVMTKDLTPLFWAAID
jgi:hypothetical protein